MVLKEPGHVPYSTAQGSVLWVVDYIVIYDLQLKTDLSFWQDSARINIITRSYGCLT
jgi:hypothetical protein